MGGMGSVSEVILDRRYGPIGLVQGSELRVTQSCNTYSDSDFAGCLNTR